MIAIEDFPDHLTSPSGLIYPTELETNRQWRMDILAEARHDKVKQDAWMERTAHDIEAWFATFLWTFNPNRTPTLTPFSPWPAQRDLVTDLSLAVSEGHDILIEKSRETGVTWMGLGVLLHFWLFGRDLPFMVLSRTEDMVDKRGDPDSLYWKLDYAVQYMPVWMQPADVRRTHMHLLNADRGGVIDGQATGGDPGRGGRRKANFIDEAAAIPELGEVLAATADNTRCRILASTPKGQNMFHRVRQSGKVKVVTMPWWKSPAKARGLYRDEEGKLRSPWYDGEVARRVSKKEIAQELDIDYIGSGEPFFDSGVLVRILADVVRPPLMVGEVDWEWNLEEGRVELVGWKEGFGRRRLKLWMALDAEGVPSTDYNYVVGVDICYGGGVASNSVISVANVNLKEKVAELADPSRSPEDLARDAVAICRWFGGNNGHAYLLWEMTGPGLMFGLEVIRMGYPYIYMRRDETVLRPRRGKKPGWASTRASKELLLSDYRRALAREDLVNYSEEAIKEAGTYQYMPNGGIEASTYEDETTGAEAAHGDRVIADALCVLGFVEQPKAPPPKQVMVPGTFAERRDLYKARGKDDGWG